MSNIQNHIMEAWRPSTFSNEDAKERHTARAAKCADCQFCEYTGPYRKLDGKAGLLFCCGVCRGALHQKTRRIGESCPTGKW